MEKYKIIECKEIFDGKAHSVVFSNGQRPTAWNDKVEPGILMQAFASGKEIELEVAPYTSKAGKTGLNIKAVGHSDETPVAERVQTDPNSRADINLPVGIAQDGKIVLKEEPKFRTPEEMIACEILKGAVELTTNAITNVVNGANGGVVEISQEQIGQVLCEAVNELTGAYKLALSNVKAL